MTSSNVPISNVYQRHVFVFYTSSSLPWIKKWKPNVSVGWSLSPAMGVSQHWGGGSHPAAYPIPPSPKTNKVSDKDQAPAGTPAPAFVRAPGHYANCDQEAASLIKHWDTSAAECSYFIQTVDGLSQSGFNCGTGHVDELIQRIWVLEDIQTLMQICNAEDKQSARVQRGKQVSHDCLSMSERWTHKKSA